MASKQAAGRGIWPIFLVMLLVGIINAFSSIAIIYGSALEAEKITLTELLRSYTRQIGAVADFDAQHSVSDHPEGAMGATLSQMRNAFARKPGFGETGEFVVGSRRGAVIDFLIKSRQLQASDAESPLDPYAAEPMHRALAGQSGTMVGVDYRSVKVLAAFEPVPQLGVGLVAKIDQREFRAPFVRAALITAGIAVVVILLGLLLIQQVELAARQVTDIEGVPMSGSPSRHREWLFYRVLLVAIVAALVNASAIAVLYGSFYEASQQRLLDMVENQAIFIGAVADFDAQYSRDYPGGAEDATLSQVRAAFDASRGFGSNGELMLGRYQDNGVAFLTQARGRASPPPAIAITEREAGPMQLALAGHSGWVTGKDYRGVEVLAAHWPVPELKAGLVAKVDLQDLRGYFVGPSRLAAAIAALSVLLASLFIWRSVPFQSVEAEVNRPTQVASGTQPGEAEAINPGLLSLAVGLALAILALDLALPLGVAGGVPYILLILLGRWFPRRRHIVWLAVIASGLSILGYFLSQPGGHEWMVLSNRLITLFAIWVTALVVSIAKASEDILNRQAQALRTLSLAVEHSPVSIMTTDPSGTIEYVNLKFTELTGYQRVEAIGQTPRMLQSQHTSRGFYQRMWAEISAGREWRGEIQNRKRDGSLYWAAASVLPIMSSSGQVMQYVSLQEDITERREAESRLRHQATHDPLSGLPNRQLALDRLAGAIAGAQRKQTQVAVLFLDLDGFKAVNDTRGHDAGDSVLMATATRLQLCVRAVDTVARIGGDEFLLLLTEIEAVHDVVAVADKLIAAVAQPHLLEDGPVRVGVSIGIALYPEHGSTPEALIQCADEVMYGVKRRGKNGFAFAVAGKS